MHPSQARWSIEVNINFYECSKATLQSSSLFLCSGQVPAEAEANFLRKAASLETYGVDPHVVKVMRAVGD